MAADKYKVQIHCLDVLSNHYHAEATDTLGNLPKFLAYVNRLIATCLNVSLGRWENFWAAEQPCIVKLVSDEAFVELFEKELQEREAEIRKQAKAKKIRFMGARRILRQRPTDTPRSKEPRRKLKPRVAAVNKWRRIEALQRLKELQAAYREAWLLWKQGFRDVVFPAGTYALARYAAVVCAPP